MGNACILVGKPERKRPVWKPGVHGKKMSKWILKKEGVSLLTGWDLIVGHGKHDIEFSGTIKVEEFLLTSYTELYYV